MHMGDKTTEKEITGTRQTQRNGNILTSQYIDEEPQVLLRTAWLMDKFFNHCQCITFSTLARLDHAT